MIGLDAVSSGDLIEYLDITSRNYEAAMLRTLGILDYEKLNDFVCTEEKSDREKALLDLLDKRLLRKKIKRANFLIDGAQNRGKIIKLYLCNNYNEKVIDKSVLVKIDKEVEFKDLIIYNPFTLHIRRYKDFEDKSINEIRYMLEHVDFRGNSLILNATTVGEFFAERIKNAVEFYDEQILRQYMEDRYDEDNMFLANKDKKVKLVQEQFKDIVEYLIDNAFECIWGELTDSQKKTMLSLLTSSGKLNLGIKEELINIFSNYTTLTELESGIVKTKAIDRFIVR